MYHRYLPKRARNILYKYLCGRFYVLKKENKIKTAEENFQDKAFTDVMGWIWSIPTMGLCGYYHYHC